MIPRSVELKLKSPGLSPDTEPSGTGQSWTSQDSPQSPAPGTDRGPPGGSEEQPPEPPEKKTGPASRPDSDEESKTNTHGVHDRQKRSHNPGEDLRGRGKTEAKSPELIHPAKSHKPQILARVGMNRDLQVSLLQVDGNHPIPRTNREKDGLDGLHLKMRGSEKTVEMREVDDRTPRPRGLPHHKQTAVKAWRR